MKKFLPLLLIIAVLCGCTQWTGQLVDGAGQRLQAYGLGRGAYYTVTEYVSITTVEALEKDYDAFLARTEGVVLIEPTQTMVFINGQARILAGEVADPYGVITDLIKIVSVFGGEIDPDTGELEIIQPVPRQLYVEFSDGWLTSKRLEALRTAKLLPLHEK